MAEYVVLDCLFTRLNNACLTLAEYKKDNSAYSFRKITHLKEFFSNYAFGYLGAMFMAGFITSNQRVLFSLMIDDYMDYIISK